MHVSAASSPRAATDEKATLLLGERHTQHRQRILRSMTGRKRRWMVAAFLAAITLGSGIINLISVMGGPTHPRFFTEIFPLEFIHLSRTVTILIGFALVISSLNIYRRKRRAWAIVLGLSSFSAVFHLTRGLEYEEAFFSLSLVALLLITRKTFSVKSSVPHLQSAIVRLVLSAGVAVGYGIAGFWFLDQRHFGINFHIGDAVWTTLKYHLSALPGGAKSLSRRTCAEPIDHSGRTCRRTRG